MRPIFWLTAPVNAPFSWPNSSLSSRPVGIAAQFSLTSVLSLRRLRSWIARAISSFPVPVSPRSRTVESLGATVSTSCKACVTAAIHQRDKTCALHAFRRCESVPLASARPTDLVNRRHHRLHRLEGSSGGIVLRHSENHLLLGQALTDGRIERIELELTQFFAWQPDPGSVAAHHLAKVGRNCAQHFAQVEI